MRSKLNKILLIDDSEADNFIASRVIRKAGVTEKVIVKYGGLPALDYLTTTVNGVYPNPELIFLDINMPGMNGWEFLEQYKSLPADQRMGIVVCMLTTSFAERDRQMAARFEVVQSYSHKPLTKKRLMEIVGEHFPELMKEEVVN